MDAINELKWHWLLEKVSEGSLGDRWIVWDENRLAIGDDNTPERAIRQAIEKPLTDAQRGYSPKFDAESSATLARLTEERDDAQHNARKYRDALESSGKATLALTEENTRLQKRAEDADRLEAMVDRMADKAVDEGAEAFRLVVENTRLREAGQKALYAMQAAREYRYIDGLVEGRVVRHDLDGAIDHIAAALVKGEA